MQLLKSDTPNLPLPAISESAEEHRNLLVRAAMSVKAITDQTTNLQARNAAVAIRQHVKEVEAERVRLTRPLLEGQRLLQQLARDHVTPIVGELIRLENMAAEWLDSENRRVEREKAAQDAELTRLMLERTAAEVAAAKAAFEFATDEELATAVAAEAKAREAAIAVQTQVAQPLAKVDKARGQSSRQVMEYEITDIEALRKAKPDCVRLVESRAMILELCCPNDGTPGIRCWLVNKATYSTR